MNEELKSKGFVKFFEIFKETFPDLDDSLRSL